MSPLGIKQPSGIVSPLGGEQLVNRVFACAVASVLLACGVLALGDTLRVDLHYRPAAIAPAGVALASRARQAMDRIAVSGFCSARSSGDPALPCKLIYVALPPDTDVSSVRIPPGSYSTTLLPGSYDVAPVPAAATSGSEIEYGRGKAITSGRNARVYARNAFYPTEQLRVVEIGHMRSWKVAVLEFWPYAYNPSTGKLRAINAAEASLSYSTTPSKAPAVSDPVADNMSDFIDNRSEAISWYSMDSRRVTSPGYVIITTSAIASASTVLKDFVSYQSGKGFYVKVATENDWGGGAGDTAAERIRAWLKSKYLSLNIQYVLLIGNPSPTSGDVPMKMLWPRLWSYSYKEAPSDYYYSDLTGNWDLDGDGYAGEEPDDFGTGGIDRIPEVYVGRIPYYGSIVTVDSILRKTIYYPGDAKGDWLHRLLLPMKPMDADTPSYQLGEQIVRDFGWHWGLAPDRVYDGAYGLSLPPEHTPCDYDVVQNEWMQGAGLVFWMTHGSTNTAGNVFSSSRCSYLDDSRPAVVYMASCSNGKPEDSTNLGYCVLAKGGITTFSASRVSWYFLAESDYTASDSIGGLGYQYARFLLSGEPCGRAAMDARLANPVTIWANHLVYNLYGDPALVYRPNATAAQPGRIGTAKLMTDGTPIHVEGVTLTRSPDGQAWYVQDTNRCAGIRVAGTWQGTDEPSPGDRVAITGQISRDREMLVMSNAQIDLMTAGAQPPPLGVPVSSIRDKKTFGLLVTIWGKVTSVSGSAFTIAGGSSKADVVAMCSGTAVPPALGSNVRIVGISTPDGVLVCLAEDIRPLLP